jgi:hypothetical protein
MRLLAAAIAVAAAFAVLAASAVQAQSHRKADQRSAGASSTVFTSRDEQGRTRTRIIIQKRSYLDGGTEVMPGDRPPANAMWLYTQRPHDALGKNSITNPPGPIPDPWYLPGKNNPWPWFVN